jgi:pimeloyl-ACP methyl ester carboxylesterase
MIPDAHYGYARTAGGLIHYCDIGSGEPILLLHATSRSLRCYRRMMPLLASRFRAVAIDLPGWGNSHPLAEGSSVEDVARTVVDFLDALGIEAAHLFGLHLGNKVGAALAAGWPDRVKKVILAGQTHSLIVDRARRDREIDRLSRHHFRGHQADATPLSRLQAWSAANATLQAQYWTPAMLRGEDVREEDIEDARIRLSDYLTGQPTLARSYPMVHAFDMTDAFARIDAETLVLELLTAEEEEAIGRQAPGMCRVMKNAVPGYLRDADNLVLEARPLEVVDAIVRFIDAGPRIPAT